ncbi:hypothetical protein NC00_04975 [Xanthomonas cannabis pv. phaseoli]|uniref:Uncharacterized protein n=1 Tax=Xanthomonas cannabis pv. phaseoli TaxID=1885902 RepID=A0AB34PB60_9XANT|nr:hypothetical protein NC00_04975 [Xanthomonas cannabis pv. phaseoli]
MQRQLGKKLIEMRRISLRVYGIQMKMVMVMPRRQACLLLKTDMCVQKNGMEKRSGVRMDVAMGGQTTKVMFGCRRGQDLERMEDHTGMFKSPVAGMIMFTQVDEGEVGANAKYTGR